TEKVFTFPEVKVGSIIEYKFSQSGIGLINWYFQRSIPTKYSRFVVDFPEELDINILPFCSRTYEQKKEEKARRVVQTFSTKDVPALRDEPFIINEDYYRDRLEMKVTALLINGRRESIINNWIRVIRNLMEDEDFGVQLKK